MGVRRGLLSYRFLSSASSPCKPTLQFHKRDASEEGIGLHLYHISEMQLNLIKNNLDKNVQINFFL